jgi:dihydroorotate dehydrogenase (fumarate)
MRELAIRASCRCDLDELSALASRAERRGWLVPVQRFIASSFALLHGRVRAALAATTGVEGPADVAEYLLAGADVVMTTSALLRHGPSHAAVLLDGLSDWMARRRFAAVDQLRGLLSVPPGTDEAAHERAGYVSALRQANSAHDPW